MSRLTLLVPIALSAVACGCGGSSDRDSELATRSSAPIAFLRDQGTVDTPHHELVVIEPDGGHELTVQLPPGYDVESFSWSRTAAAWSFRPIRQGLQLDAVRVRGERDRQRSAQAHAGRGTTFRFPSGRRAETRSPSTCRTTVTTWCG